MYSLPDKERQNMETPAEPRASYEPPAIIYEGTISTRAGTPVGQEPTSRDDGVDPADLFGE